jgi:hypothetical protein
MHVARSSEQWFNADTDAIIQDRRGRFECYIKCPLKLNNQQCHRKPSRDKQVIDQVPVRRVLAEAYPNQEIENLRTEILK